MKAIMVRTFFSIVLMCAFFMNCKPTEPEKQSLHSQIRGAWYISYLYWDGAAHVYSEVITTSVLVFENELYTAYDRHNDIVTAWCGTYGITDDDQMNNKLTGVITGVIGFSPARRIAIINDEMIFYDREKGETCEVKLKRWTGPVPLWPNLKFHLQGKWGTFC